MDDVLRIQSTSHRRTFTLQEARKYLPVVRRITENARERYNSVVFQLSTSAVDSATWVCLEEEATSLVRGWADSIGRLGCSAQGLWTVDFDCGSGYYCWRLGESDVEHFHGYDDGFRDRVRIPDNST
ncbi:MAG: DUF2203 family protein [Myxococcales bacterium]|nr:DUF2203 family protein [Myxococcales bacterium]